MDILAKIDNYALLQNGKVPVIGYIKQRERYSINGGCVIPTIVCFHFGTQHKDFFYFENDKLIYKSISLATPTYLIAVYFECVKSGILSMEKFIAKVTAKYVFTEMGF